MTLIATPGASNANSYITVADADAYFATRPFSDDWTVLLTAVKESALISATTRLDTYDYVGIVVTSTQALKWPRQLDTTGALIRNYAVNIIPPPIQKATCEAALALMQSGGAAAVAGGAVQNVKVGSLSITYSSGSAAVVDTSVDYSGLDVRAARFLSGLRLIPVG